MLSDSTRASLMTLLVQASQDTEEVPFLQKADSSVEPMDVGCSWLWFLKIVKTGPLFSFKGLGTIPCGSCLRAILMLTQSHVTHLLDAILKSERICQNYFNHCV